MKKLYILAGVLAVITGLLFYAYLLNLGKQSETEKDRIVVAAQDIGKMETITSEMLKVIEVEKGSAHPASVSDPEQLIGMVTEYEILEGEPVYQKKLIQIGSSESGLAYTVPMNKRALSISVDQISGVSGYLQVNDLVDIIATVTKLEKAADGTEKTKSSSGILVEKLTVLACGSKQTTDDGTLLYESITLAVTPEQAVSITQAATQGMLRIMLRNPQDSGTVKLPTVDNDKLFQ